jgi:hypothetical protein
MSREADDTETYRVAVGLGVRMHSLSSLPQQSILIDKVDLMLRNAKLIGAAIVYT